MVRDRIIEGGSSSFHPGASLDAGAARAPRSLLASRLEMAKFDKSVDMALEKGIKDSFGSAITGALSGYLDLGASSLILWYGGSLAMDGEDRMTAGELITYQL